MTIAADRAALTAEIEEKIGAIFPDAAALTPPQIAEALTRIIGRKVGPEQVRRLAHALELHNGVQPNGTLAELEPGPDGVLRIAISALARCMTDMVIKPPLLAPASARDPRIGRDLRPSRVGRGGRPSRHLPQWAINGPLVFLLDGEAEPNELSRVVRLTTDPVPDASPAWSEWAGQVGDALQAYQRSLLNEEAREQSSDDRAELRAVAGLSDEAPPPRRGKVGGL